MTNAGEPDQSELDQVERDIEEARRNAEEHGTIPDSTPEPTFIDPDADGDIEDGGDGVNLGAPI